MAIQLLPIAAVVGIGAAAGTAVGVAVTKAKSIYDTRRYYKDGYNNLGYDREGFDREGFDERGFDKEGFNREGYDRRGFDKNGYDRAGYDRKGFDRSGWDKSGYSRDGYDENGYNRKGYDRNGWNPYGRDVSGHGADYYADCVARIEERVSEAKKYMSSRNYEHASLEIRKGAEQAVKCIISHNLGSSSYKRHFESDIDACKGILDEGMVDKLHGLRKICSEQLHPDEPEHTNLHDRFFFSLKTLEETLPFIRKYAAF